MIEIIPDRILSLLSLKSEPIDNWNEQTDLLEFLYILNDKEFSSTSATDEKSSGSYKNYGKHIFDTGLSKFKSLTTNFHYGAISSIPSPGSSINEISIPDFCKSSEYGLMAKYSVAWDGIVGEILSESASFSIAHTLESESDLNCSIQLASNLYYKHALQALRGFLENLLLPLFFINNLPNFVEWKENNFHTPTIRGNNGILNKLVSNKQVSIELAEDISTLYKTFNQFIHGSENRLIHKGIFNGQWSGQIFKIEDFNEWCLGFAKTVEVGIKLSKIKVDTWSENEERNVDPFCLICHNTENFRVEVERFSENIHFVYHCNVCGNSYRK